jgi:undecaprenyl-diphosphatase
VHTNAFDTHILHFLNSFTHRSWTLDAFVMMFVSDDLLKGAVMMSMFWWAWVRRDAKTEEHRAVLVFGMFTCLASVCFARLMTLKLPFRVRPLHNPELHFQLPYSLDPATLAGWSSFPSDHMVLYTCVAMSIWLVNRRVGTVALLFALIGTGIPRIYAGFHYPTDILGGMAVGAAFALLSQIRWLREMIAGPCIRWMYEHPQSFYACMFICTFGVAEAYGSSYLVVMDLVKICRSAL